MECQRTKSEDGLTVLEPKRQYVTLEDAIKACKVMNSFPDRVEKLVPYKCTQCYKFHIGRNGKLIDPKNKLTRTQLKVKYGDSVHVPLPKKQEFKGFTLVGHIDLTKFKEKNGKHI